MSDTRMWTDSRIIAEVDDYLGEADNETRERARRLLRRAVLNEGKWYEERMAELRHHIAKLKAQLAGATRWKPVTIAEHINCDCDDDSCTNTLCSDGDLLTLENETGIWSIVLPDMYAVCHLTDAPALDMPDGPGWWAFKGKHVIVGERDAELVIRFDEWVTSPDSPLLQYRRDGERWPVTTRIAFFREEYQGKFYRLTMPWETNNEDGTD